MSESIKDRIKKRWSSYWYEGEHSRSYKWLNKTDDDIRLVELMNIRKGVSNFVKLICGMDVPVTFQSDDGQSKTDGKVITISADTNPNYYDTTIGLAMHEAMHCKMSQHIFEFFTLISESAISRALNRLMTLSNYTTKVAPIELFHLVLNVMEDRRIDDWLYTTAPGWRPYYEEMYEKLFYSPHVNELLKSDKFREVTLRSYMSALMSVHNRNLDVDALPYLREIVEIMDIDNISRYNTTDEVLRWKKMTESLGGSGHAEFTTKNNSAAPQMFLDCVTITDIIWSVCKTDSDNKDYNTFLGSGRSYGNRDDRTTQQKSEIVSDYLKQKSKQTEPAKGAKTGEGEGATADGGEGATADGYESALEAEMEKSAVNSLDKDAEDILHDDLQKMINFTEGWTERTGTGRELFEKLELIKGFKTEVREGSVEAGASVPVLIYDLTSSKKGDAKKFLGTVGINFYYDGYSFKTDIEKRIEAGIRMGGVLASRLQVMNQEDKLVSPNQKSGRIDKRKIALIPTESEYLFTLSKDERLKPVLLDLSIDSSGSMSGGKWLRTVQLTVALAVAATKIKSLDIRISLRASSTYPYVIILFDSRRNTWNEFVRIIRLMHPSGGTPEGLAFQAMNREILEANKGTRRLFVNISDGEPSYGGTFASGKQVAMNYYGDAAAKHTAAEIKKMREAGITILSYYVSDSSSLPGRNKIFDMMYGKDAVYINVESILDIARTLNKMFLDSDNREDR